MKLPALIAFGLLVAATPVLAYPTDDFGFPIENPRWSASQTTRSYYRPAFRFVQPRQSERVCYTTTRPTETLVTTVTRSTPSRPVQSIVVTPKPSTEKSAIVVGARPTEAKQR